MLVMESEILRFQGDVLPLTLCMLHTTIFKTGTVFAKMRSAKLHVLQSSQEWRFPSDIHYHSLIKQDVSTVRPSCLVLIACSL